MSLEEIVERCLSSAASTGPFEGVLEWVPAFPNSPNTESLHLIPHDAHRFIGAVIDVMETQLHGHNSNGMWKRTPVLVQLQQFAEISAFVSLLSGGGRSAAKKRSLATLGESNKRQKTGEGED